MTCLMIASSGDGEEPSPAIHVELPIEAGRYDARPLSEINLGVKTTSNGQAWFPLTARTRIALSLLKAAGTLKNYEIRSNHISLEFNAAKIGDIQAVLIPPQFVNADDFAGQQQVAVLIHGLEGSAMTFREFAPAIEDRGWFPLKMVYPNDGAIDKPADFLRSELSRLHRRYPNTRFVIIAHSLGGLVAWDALTDAPGGSTGVTDLVTLGTPYGGSSMASFQSELELADVAIRIMHGDLSARDIDSDGSGEAIDILLPGSVERRRLLARPLPQSIRLHVIAGDGGPIEAKNHQTFSELIERLINKFKPKEAYATNLRSLAHAPELIAGTGDGAVSVQSATAVNRFESKQVFHRSHVGLVAPTDANDAEEVITWILSKIDPASRP
ncbi:MAG TPA: hypothetical protein DDZ51_18250 [Planctomycetaceae bacterium]|nr:hypothetical protein [Planctomycetaceae bacterium]